MSDRFQNKYRIKPARLENWDYGWNAAYFVTICTYKRVRFFGDVANAEMVLNKIGEIANHCWLEIPNHFPFAKLGCNMVMPDHIHGIVLIDRRDDGNNVSNNGRNVQTPNLGVSVMDTRNTIDTTNDTRNVQTPNLGISVMDTRNTIDTTNDARNVQTPNLGVSTIDTGNRTHAASEKWKSGTLGVIINQYKRAVTIRARKINPDFAWHSRYHDHIIRDDKSFHRISKYIINNPLKWSDA